MQLQCSQEVTNMGVSSVRMSKEEEELIRGYCKLHNISISEAFKSALLEKIEDEYDIMLAEEALDDLKKNPNQKFYTQEEFDKMFNL